MHRTEEGPKLYVCQQEQTISGLPFRREDADGKSGPNNEWGSRVHELFDLISTLDHCLDARSKSESRYGVFNSNQAIVAEN